MQESQMSTRPAMQWAWVSDAQGRPRLQAAWAVAVSHPGDTSAPHAA